MADCTAIYDACVLYPAPLRDFLMHLALTGLFRAKWTNDIHEEWMRNVLAKRPNLQRKDLERTRDLMNLHALDCMVEDYERVISTLSLPDPNDRHVLAAAIHTKADVIVTFNDKDFPAEVLSPHGIETQRPDDFISQWINANPTLVCIAAKRHRQSLKNPPKSVDEYLGTLDRQRLPQSVTMLRELESLI